MVVESLWARYAQLRGMFGEMERLKGDRAFLAQFRSPQEFVDWFKAFIDPLLSLHYDAGALWARNADVPGVVAWLRQGAWNRLQFNLAVSRAVTEYRDLIDTEFLGAFAQQLSDEARMYHLRVKLLRMFRGSMEGFQPMREWVALFDHALGCASRRLERPHFHVRFVSTLHVVKLTNVYHNKGVYENLPRNPVLWSQQRSAAALLRESFREIEDDELFHWSIAERVWMKYATTPEMRAEILDCAPEALRLGTEARIRRVEAALAAR